MALQELNAATTTNISVPDFIVNSKVLDTTNATGETFWYFSEATQNMGYYSEIPEINSAANTLATWSTSRGWTTEDVQMEVILPKMDGMGKDTFETLMWNHLIMKFVVGDAFMEIVRNDKGTLVNMIPISPERVRVVFQENGRIKRYDLWKGNKWKPIKIKNMLHSQNKRLGDQLHGTSQIDAVKWIIDARNEALITNRMLEKRGRALGIVYYETSNEGKISYANSQIEKAVKNGQMVGLPKDTAEIKEFPMKPLAERMDWIRYLETFFYQVFGVPRSIATSDGTSEVGGINGHLIFEPIYAKEQLELEMDLWNQVAIKIKFNRPPSLAPKTQENATKNTGQTSIQPAEVEPKINR
jgi:hypothetical protein